MHNFPLDKAFQELDTYAVCTCDVILGVRRCVLLACADGSFALEARVEWTRMHM